MQGARNAEAEIVRGVQRGCEYRATQKFAAISTTCQLAGVVLVISFSEKFFCKGLNSALVSNNYAGYSAVVFFWTVGTSTVTDRPFVSGLSCGM